MEKTELMVRKARLSIMRSYPFFATLVSVLVPVADDSIISNGIPTMATDGMRLYYHPELADTQRYSSLNDFVFTVMHETLHCVLLHVTRRDRHGDKIDKNIWNMAADYVVHDVMRQMGFVIPPDCLYDRRFQNMSVEQVYRILMNEKQEFLKKIQEMLKNGKIRITHHDLWATGAGENDKEQQDADGKKQGQNKQGQDGAHSFSLESYWKEKVANAFIMSEVGNTWRQKGRGSMPAQLKELIEDLYRPIINIRQVLTKYMKMTVTQTCNWNRRDKRYWNSFQAYVPTYKDKTLDLMVVLDTSGSITTEDARYFLGIFSDILGHLPIQRVRYMEVDAEIHTDKIISLKGQRGRIANLFPDKIEISGRGGTSFDPPFQKIKDERYAPGVIIYLTDGNCEFPDRNLKPPCPVLWVFNHKRNMDDKITFGQYVGFDEKDIEAEHKRQKEIEEYATTAGLQL